MRGFLAREYLSAPLRVVWKGTRFCRRVLFRSFFLSFFLSSVFLFLPLAPSKGVWVCRNYIFPNFYLQFSVVQLFDGLRITSIYLIEYGVPQMLESYAWFSMTQSLGPLPEHWLYSEKLQINNLSFNNIPFFSGGSREVAKLSFQDVDYYLFAYVFSCPTSCQQFYIRF